LTRKLDIPALVIGSGPGGYVCAIRLGQLGVPTVLVDKGALGGVCLNVGCIPSKALIAASRRLVEIREAEAIGIRVDGVSVDLGRMMAWKGGITGKLSDGVKTLVEGNAGKILRGTARFLGPHEVLVTGEPDQTIVRFEHAVIATGSVPALLPGFPFDGERVVSSTEALSFTSLPERLVVIGGGYIGMELGGVYQRLGSRVTVIEYLDQILPGFERDLVRPVEKRFKEAGGTIRTGTAARRFEPLGAGVRVWVEPREGGAASALDADRILVTTGRRPLTEGLAPEVAGVRVDPKGFIPVDGAQRTNVPHIFAIGDVAGEPMLAHKASKEGEVAAEVIAGKPAAFDVRAIPAVVFTDPEIATVGLTVEEARARGFEPRVGKFSFAGNGRALSLCHAEGFVRVVVDAKTEVLLGMQLVGPDVSNLVAEGALALETGALASDVGLTIHAHPTLSEVVAEATNAALGRAVHALNR
jgi:dihydrolipoamide dehydrogenase